MRLASSLVRSLACAVAVALVAGCSDATVPPEEPSVVGTYTLASVEGHPLPAPFYRDDQYGVASDFVRGSMTLAADGTWTREYTIHTNHGNRDTVPYDTHYQGSGTYAVEGDAIHLWGTERSGFDGPGPIPPVDARREGTQIVVVHLNASPGARFVRD